MPVMHAPLPCVPYGPSCPYGEQARLMTERDMLVAKNGELKGQIDGAKTLAQGPNPNPNPNPNPKHPEHGSAFSRVNLLVSFSAWASRTYPTPIPHLSDTYPTHIPHLSHTYPTHIPHLSDTYPTPIRHPSDTHPTPIHKHCQPEFDPRNPAMELC